MDVIIAIATNGHVVSVTMCSKGRVQQAYTELIVARNYVALLTGLAEHIPRLLGNSHRLVAIGISAPENEPSNPRLFLGWTGVRLAEVLKNRHNVPVATVANEGLVIDYDNVAAQNAAIDAALALLR
ncbi:MAG TPA: hypothetical protein VK502_00615 [Candidatus Saccharimonadales bacterium]|nr:hypothetical protein [Candidatus Saccharimonadales bacterium]